MQNTIKIASAVITNDAGELLVVRKSNSTFYMLPGGKIENDETLTQTLIRELQEELDLRLHENEFDFLGTHRTQAANEPNTIVEGNIFRLKKPLHLKINNQAEIEEIAWLSKKTYQNYKLAHLLKEFALDKWLNSTP